jgi:Rad3-related DNA helicase
MHVSLPPPAACGAPVEFQAWREGQSQAVCHVTDTPARVSGLVLPTGAGKSLITTAIATLTGWRTAILTSTKGLQDQILTTYASTGMVDLRGQVAYPCRALAPGGVLQQYRTPGGPTDCSVGPCKAGLYCPWRTIGCGYFDAIGKAQRERLLVTNYQAWMSQYGYGEGLGQWDCLICDEAHAAPDEVASFLASIVTARQLDALALAPPVATDIEAWCAWAKEHRAEVARAVETLTTKAKTGTLSPQLSAELRQARDLLNTIRRLETATPGDWIVLASPRQASFEFHALDVGRHVEGALFRGIPHVVLTSATLTSKTTEALGLDPARIAWLSVPSTFPVERRPITHVVTCRIDHRLDHAGTQQWLTRVDQILRARPDRKGLIHTGSYARAQLIYNHSECRHRLLFHDRATTRQRVEQFRAAPAGTVMVSPSLTTGFDFPGRSCEFQIILKVPWPDAREPVVAARTVRDKTYPAYLAMQDLVQAVGRGMRSAEDQCETIILDDHVKWFVHQYRAFAPQWFLDAYKSSLTIPLPPPPLP